MQIYNPFSYSHWQQANGEYNYPAAFQVRTTRTATVRFGLPATIWQEPMVLRDRRWGRTGVLSDSNFCPQI